MLSQESPSRALRWPTLFGTAPVIVYSKRRKPLTDGVIRTVPLMVPAVGPWLVDDLDRVAIEIPVCALEIA
jgi:hypothetical protein